MCRSSLVVEAVDSCNMSRTRLPLCCAFLHIGAHKSELTTLFDALNLPRTMKTQAISTFLLASVIAACLGDIRASRFEATDNEMMRRNAKKGLATLCIGGGMGVAMCIERA